METNETKTNDNNAMEIGDDLRITKTTRRTTAGGTWVLGAIAGHRFSALVFPEHAEAAAFELDNSRISKLWLQTPADRQTVANFDRGWDIRPTSETAWAIVDFLAAGLADHVYHK